MPETSVKALEWHVPKSLRAFCLNRLSTRPLDQSFTHYSRRFFKILYSISCCQKWDFKTKRILFENSSLQSTILTMGLSKMPSSHLFQKISNSEVLDLVFSCSLPNVFDSKFSGYEPYGGEKGVSLREACDNFWIPVLRAVKNIQRREDIFIAGRNHQICKPS